MRNIPNELHKLLTDLTSVLQDINDELALKYRPTVSKFQDIAEQIHNIYMFDRMTINGMEPVTDLNNEKVYFTNDLYYLTADNYQFVEYLQSDGFQYINTEWVPSLPYTLEVEFEMSAFPSGEADFFGNAPSGQATPVGGVTGSNLFMWAYSGTSWTPTSYTLNEKHIVKYGWIDGSNRTLDYDGTLYTKTSTTNRMHTATLGLFSSSATSARYPISAKVSYFKIIVNNNIIHYYQPCYRKSDNKPGLYDTVEDKFYVNQGTGEFIVGPDIVE